MSSLDAQTTRSQGWYAAFKQAVKALKRQVLAINYALQDDRTPWYAKAVALLVLAYALSPLDLIPDFIPILGLIDDLLLLPGLILLTIYMIPTNVMEDAHARAENEPLRLSRNWLMACLIAVIWIVSLDWILMVVINAFGHGTLKEHVIEIVGWSGYAMAVIFLIWMMNALHKEARKANKQRAAGVLKPPQDAVCISVTSGQGRSASHTANDGAQALHQPLLPQ